MQPDLLLAIVIVGSLIFYVLLGGADYGGGLWDLLSWGAGGQKQRDLIAHAITPVWEMNHVWLILVVVLLFSGFPSAFSAITTALHIPILVLLVGIIFRGVSFTFRTYDTRSIRVQRIWGFGFSVASIITPFLLGVIVGAITQGRVVVSNGVSVNGFLWTWFSSFSLIVGCFAVSLFAYLAAVYLTVEANTQGLREAFRSRALVTGVVVAVFALLTFLSASSEAVQVEDALLSRPWSWLEQGATAVASICAFWALWRRRFSIARFAVAVQVSLILLGWALAQYPFLVRPLLTIQNSSTSRTVLRDLLLACAAGVVVLLPSLHYLFKVFKANPEAMHSKPLH